MATDNQPAWEVTGQREDYGALPNGQYGPGVMVSFRTRSGATGSVFVPGTSYNVDTVRSMVATQAEAMEAVHQLKG